MRPIVIRAAGRSHCLQPARNSATAVDPCIGKRPACGGSGGPMTREARFRKETKSMVLAKFAPVEGRQDKSRKVRRGRMSVKQRFLSRIRKVRMVSAMCDFEDEIVLSLSFARCGSGSLVRKSSAARNFVLLRKPIANSGSLAGPSDARQGSRCARPAPPAQGLD
jgi:hypothetical protein